MVQQRLLVARRGQVQAVGVVIEARPDVVEGRAWGLGSSLGLLVLRCLGLRGRVLLVVLLRMRLVGLVVQWLLLLRVWLLLRVRLLVGVWLLVVGRCLRVRDVLRGGGLVALEVGLLVGGLLLVVGVLLVRVLLFRMLLMVGLVELLLERLRGLVGPGLGRGDRAGCVRV
ncbi:hypothetical protein CP973_33000 [Streptomyces albofaciens JCM 4342]|nr:hypothetical protein CP973_33000 [Streptomyces albofaciens JCM 4342]